MQATLDASALKPFTKAITCLSRYGEELSIYATVDSLSLSSTNSSKSAYCRFKYDTHFFSKYRVGGQGQSDSIGIESVTGQLLTRSLLSILKPRTVEKAVERCELSILEGLDEDEQTEDQDSLESRLIVRMHCKHGVVKTHRLSLMTPTPLMSPGAPDATNDSRLTVGPKALKDMIDHFPISKGAKSDPQLVWCFGETEVELRTLESSIDSRGKGQLNTELTISAEEFDIYEIYSPPTTLAFHLREFNATIAYADSMSLPLDFRFTNPSEPLFIDVEGDCTESLFVISTSQTTGIPTNTAQNPPHSLNKKRDRGEASADTPRIKKPMKVVQRAEAPASSRTPPMQSHPPGLTASNTPIPDLHSHENPVQFGSPLPPVVCPVSQKIREPLFLPSSSQFSVANEQDLRATGLGVEEMDANELEAMLEGEGEEVAFDFGSQVSEKNGTTAQGTEGLESLQIEEVEFAATQMPPSKTFRPLFRD